MSKTLDYYAAHAEAFSASTRDVAFASVQELFLSYLKPDAKILDFGCGSGRDAKYFLNQGYDVEASDGSEELCQLASSYIGKPVHKLLFTELNEEEAYHGIWACASILHCPIDELQEVFMRMIRALKTEGIIYASFKHGEFSGDRNGRFFTDFTEDTFRKFVEGYPELLIEKMWLTSDVRPGRGEEKWLNIILRKTVN